MNENLSIAFVHDWLTGMRGGEKVLEALFELYPHADLYTLIHNRGSVSTIIEKRRIVTSFIDKFPFKSKHYRHYLPLFPTAIELFNFKEYNLIISTSHCVAKGIRTPPNALHIAYIHSPMRYVWDMYDDYFSADNLNFLSRRFIPLFANYLRIWDVTSSNRVDHFIANSKHVAKRIWKYFRREATIIHPPIDCELFNISHDSGDYYLIVSALVPYKRIDLAVEVFNTLDQELFIIGDGPEKKRLQKSAKKNIKFLDWIPSQDLVKYYSHCRALIFPGEEDFGMVPVETQLNGRPVIAYRLGGALETVLGYDGTNEGQCTGVFFAEQTEQALLDAITQFEKLNWDCDFIHKHAQKFSKERFLNEFKQFIDEKLSEFYRI
jgi:glycosyltransferase involved in cell wall biosynthesis